jgi:hypothetical protein
MSDRISRPGYDAWPQRESGRPVPARSRVRRRTNPAGRLRHFAVIAAVYLIFASCIAASAAHVLHLRSEPVALLLRDPAVTVPKYLVLMVLDGARPDYLDVTSLPHVDALRSQGAQFSNAIDGILEAETPAGHATIASGSRPDRDGILGFDWAANSSDSYSLFSPDQMGALEQILQNTHVPTLAGLYKQRYPTAKVVALSGHKYYAAAPLGGPSADAIMYYEGDSKGRYVPVAVPGHVPPANLLNDPSLIDPTIHLSDGQEDHLATKLALATVQQMRPRMLLINYPEFDWPLGHVDGGNLDPAKVTIDMKQFDADLGQIEDAYRRAGVLDQTLFVITADHGMMPIAHFIPSTEINNAIAQAGTTSPDVAENTGDFIWLADPTKAQTVAQNIINLHDSSIQSAYYLTTTNGRPGYVSAHPRSLTPQQEAANQYLLSGLINGHEPAVVVFAVEGATFSDPKAGWKGDHGGNSWQSQHIPLILAGPGIRPGVTSNAPVQLEDVAPTVLSDMGVAPTGMEGHIITDILGTSTPADQHARAAEVTQLGPIAQALTDQTTQQADGS